MNQFFGLVTNVLKSKFFWIAVAIVVIYVVIKRNWSQIAYLGKPRFIEYETNAAGDVLDLSKDKEAELKHLAERLYTQMYSYWPNDFKVYEETRYLNDQELNYMTKYYNKAYAPADLASDIDDEVLAGTDADESIISRLKKMGLARN